MATFRVWNVWNRSCLGPFCLEPTNLSRRRLWALWDLGLPQPKPPKKFAALEHCQKHLKKCSSSMFKRIRNRNTGYRYYRFWCTKYSVHCTYRYLWMENLLTRCTALFRDSPEPIETKTGLRAFWLVSTAAPNTSPLSVANSNESPCIHMLIRDHRLKHEEKQNVSTVVNGEKNHHIFGFFFR